jgi:uncharacterized protein YbbK (DUF523 family)
LGRPVRYDGGHKRAAALAALGRRVRWVEVCPELEAGMGVPREPVRLAGPGPRLVGVTSGADWTGRMRALARRRIRQLRRLGVAGYVFKARSPSCGIRGVAGGGRGLFAAALLEALPELPVADEEQLATRAAREAFLARVRAYGKEERR